MTPLTLPLHLGIKLTTLQVQHGDKYSKFMYSMCLVCCASGMHNSITTASKTIIVRSTHVTGTITDIFMVLGFYARTGNPVHLWKLKVSTRLARWSYCLLFLNHILQSFIFFLWNAHSSCCAQVWIPSWMGFLVGVAAGAGLFFAINAWGIVVPVVLLSPVWLWGLVRTSCFGLARRLRGSDSTEHHELRD